MFAYVFVCECVCVYVCVCEISYASSLFAFKKHDSLAMLFQLQNPNTDPTEPSTMLGP